MLNVHFTVLAILELALLHQCLPEPNQLAAFPLFTAPSSNTISFRRFFAPRIRRRNSLATIVDGAIGDQSSLLTNLTSFHTTVHHGSGPFSYELYLHQSQLPQNDVIHTLLPVLQTAPIELINPPHPHYHLNHFHNDLTGHRPAPVANRLENGGRSNSRQQLDNRLDRLDRLDSDQLPDGSNGFTDRQLMNANQLLNAAGQFNQNPHHQNAHQPILIHHAAPIQHYSFYHFHPHLVHRHPSSASSSSSSTSSHPLPSSAHHPSNLQVLNRISNLNIPIVNQRPFSLFNKVQQLKQRLKQQKSKLKPAKLLDYHKSIKSFGKLSQLNKLSNYRVGKSKSDQSLTTVDPLSGNGFRTTTKSSPVRTGYLEIGSTAHLNQFGLETEGGEDDVQYPDHSAENQLDSLDSSANSNPDNGLDNRLTDKESSNRGNELSDKIVNNRAVSSKFDADFNDTSALLSSNDTGNVINFLAPTSFIRADLEQLLQQFKPADFVQHFNPNLDQHHQLDSKYAYDLIGSNSTSSNFSSQDINQNVQFDFKERTAPDIHAGIFSRALGGLSNILPSAMKITRTSGCVGGTRCQFFLSCWMSSGSLGSSCGPLSTCCITPSKQDIQPAFYGPVINDPHCGRSATRISRIVGGQDASFGQFPWQAFVQVGGSRCGGALVGQKHVVTAGHCVARSQHNPSDIRVTLGDYILNSDIESLPHEVFSVADVKLHPNFRFTPQADRYDVAILILDRNVQYRNNIKPICLPPKDASFLGRVAYVAGWGALSAGSKLRPKVLQHVNVPVIDNVQCEIWHRKRGINIKIHDEMICAGYQAGNKDACQGDSGGPLMFKNEFGVWYLIGIVSAGYSCAKQFQPGIYHRVSSSSDWVSSIITT